MNIHAREWLKQIREHKTLSQSQAAKLSGISQTYFAGIEKGIRGNPLNVDIAKSIALALEFDWTKFYEDVAPRQA